MTYVQDDLGEKKKTLLNHYQHHLLWSGWEVGQSLADMKMWSFAAVSSASASLVDTGHRKDLTRRWRRAEVEKGVFVALGGYRRWG